MSEPGGIGAVRLAMLLRRGNIALIPRVRHLIGLPPEVSGNETRQLLPQARVLVIEKHNSQVFLIRYDETSSEVGDTWHQSLEDAKYQAEFEYGPLITEWKSIPPEVEEVVTFMLSEDE